MLDILKKNYKIIIFAIIILIAIGLRTWHFHDWLFFKMDQARDALLIKQTLENGLGWLPLLGPKAGGTHLNLGPAFYYFQYMAVFLFQSAHPAVLAYPDLLFSILSIPLFYFFLKKYFSRDWSMILAGIYALCFLGIEYSRFAWNPNSLVFFNLLYFYALLNIFDESIKYKLRWIIAAGLSFAVSTQLHFLSFATLPVITVIFFLFSRKEIKKNLGWKKILLFFVMIFLVYLPVFANEIITHGKNTDAFFVAIKSKPSHHSLWKNILRDFRYWGQNWFLIITSWISKKASLKPAIIAWFGLIIPGLLLAAKFYRAEKNSLKKKFLLLSILWFLSYFLIYIPISYQIRPRFFLPLLALPFLFIGFIAKYFWEKNKNIWKILVIVVLTVILAGNLYGTHLWFKEINSAQKKGIYPQRTIILKARDGIVLWHLEKAVQYIKSDCDSNTVYFYSSNEYKRSIIYLLNYENIKGLQITHMAVGQRECTYAILLTRSKEKNLPAKFMEKFDRGTEQKIGSLTVVKLNIKDEYFGQNLNYAKKQLPEEADELKRVFWKDIAK